VDIGLFMLFARGFGLPYLRVAAATFTVATLLNYFLSVRFVFVSGLRYTPRWELALVFAVSLMGLGINQLILSLGVDRWGFDLLLSKLAATGSVFFWNYFARRLIVFGATH
jgi:putative flippase GtrA